MSPRELHVDDRLALFGEHRPYVFAVAYRMLGIAEDAEDVLQEAWIRFAGAELEELRSPRGYLVTIVTRLSLDLLRSARRRREEYAGVWLPEPVTSREALPEELAEQAESASFAFLLLLERLSAVERVVLVLHDVFDHGHEEIGRVTGRSTAASRQALRRARRKLEAAPPPPTPVPRPEMEPLLTNVLQATASGDVERVIALLAPDVVLFGDGGGLVQTINRPLAGSREVGRFLVAMAALTPADARVELHELNGQPGFVLYEGGALTNAFLFEATAAGITAIYMVRNPEKLARVAAAIG